MFNNSNIIIMIFDLLGNKSLGIDIIMNTYSYVAIGTRNEEPWPLFKFKALHTSEFNFVI